MTQSQSVSLVTTSSQIDVRVAGSSTRAGGIQFPIDLLSSQSLTSATYNFNRLGEPDNTATLNLSQSGNTVAITVSATGFTQ